MIGKSINYATQIFLERGFIKVLRKGGTSEEELIEH